MEFQDNLYNFFINPTENELQEFVNDFNNLISRLDRNQISLLFDNKIIIKSIIDNNLFWNNIEVIMKKVTDRFIMFYITKLFNINKEYILDNITKLSIYSKSTYFWKDYFEFLNKNNEIDECINYLIKNNISIPYNFVIRKLIEINRFDIISKNFDYFLSNNNQLLNLKIILKYYNYDNLINKEIDDNPDRVVEEIMLPRLRLNIDVLKEEQVFEFLKEIIKELVKSENISYHDTTYLGSGGYSDVYKFNAKVLKIGFQRQSFKIKNNKRFLKPLYRAEINSLKHKQCLFCIEITELVNRDDITDEDTYQIYKELREQGLVWTDCRDDNLCRLMSDNTIHYQENISPSIEATGYLDDNNEVLKAGELVILDNDYIFDEKEYELNKTDEEWCNENISDYKLLNDYENRYLSEKEVNMKK